MSGPQTMLDLIRQVHVVTIPPRRPQHARAPLHALLELALPGGMKDRVALSLVEQAEADGRLRPGGVILESSSGTLAEGLARVGSLKGYRVVIVTDPRIDQLTLTKLKALGAELDVVEHYDPQGGWQSSRLRRLGELMRTLPGAVWTQQYDNPANPQAYGHVGERVVEALGDRIGALVVSVGSGGSACGIAASLRRRVPDLQVVAVDAVGSVLFNQPDRKRLQSGHSNSVVPGNLDHRVFDSVHWLSDGEAFQGCQRLALDTGVFGGGSSGATWVAASWVAEQLPADLPVLAVLPDRGDRYYRTVYSSDYHREHGLESVAIPDEPQRIRYGRDIAESWSWAPLPHGEDIPYWTEGAPATGRLAETLGLVPARAGA